MFVIGKGVRWRWRRVARAKLAYRFALDLTAAQQWALRSHAGAARFA